MKSTQVALNATTDTSIITAKPLYRECIVHVLTSATIYVGPSGVTSSTGLKIDNAAGPITITVPSNETLFAIAATGTPTVSVLVPGD
jgi:Tfp pilus assembly protein FimV